MDHSQELRARATRLHEMALKAREAQHVMANEIEALANAALSQAEDGNAQTARRVPLPSERQPFPL